MDPLTVYMRYVCLALGIQRGAVVEGSVFGVVVFFFFDGGVGGWFNKGQDETYTWGLYFPIREDLSL